MTLIIHSFGTKVGFLLFSGTQISESYTRSYICEYTLKSQLMHEDMDAYLAANICESPWIYLSQICFYRHLALNVMFNLS